MSVVLDERIADRRRDVQEDGARHRLRRLMLVLLLVALIAASVWVLQSPLLAVDTIIVNGAVRADVDTILSEAGVSEGVPTVGVRAGSVEDALREDPWIINADVSVTWPGTVEVVVLEHEPVAWVVTDARWMLVSATGDVLRWAESPETRLPIIELADVPVARPGEVLEHDGAVGAALFVAYLPEDLRHGVTVTGLDGGLWAQVRGHPVRLGRPVDMAEKGVALGAIFEDPIPAGASIDLISPDWPAIGPNPHAEVEGQGESSAEAQPED